jgi:BASS family bile acid:Na+ symporter
MALLQFLASILAWLGRQGTRAVAISLVVGLAVPQLAALFKPFVTEQVFILLCLAFLRVEPAALRVHAERPRILAAATIWTMILLPGLLGAFYLFIGLPRWPDLLLSLMLQIAAPPIMSAPAFAALLGLDAGLALALLVVSIALTPVVAPIFVALFLGGTVEIFALDLGIKLFLLLASAAFVAVLLRWLAGRHWIERQTERIDGLNVIVMFCFAVALMEEVATRVFTEPGLVFGLMAVSFAFTMGIIAATMLVMRRAGAARAFAIGFSAGNRNMALMLAATAGALPDLTWLYFALAQFPIYLLPQLLKPLARRLAQANNPPAEPISR